MGKNLLLNAENRFLKGEKLYKARQFKKAGKNYNLAGNNFLKLDKYEQAKVSFIKGANSFIELDKIDTTLTFLRMAGDSSILDEDYIGANEIFRKAITFIPRLRIPSNKNQNYILFSVLSYLCLFTKGRQVEGLDFLKRVQKKVDSAYFKENSLVRLVTDLTIGLRDKNLEYLEKTQKNIDIYKLNEVESNLLKVVVLLAQIQLLLQTNLSLDKEIYTTKDIINLTVDFDTKPILSIFKGTFNNYSIKDFQITKLNLHLSDNLTTSKKPDVPIPLDVGKNYQFDFMVKPHFQLDNPFIGPLSIMCKVNEDLIFNYDSDSLKPKLISPSPTLDVSIKNLRPPLIDQTFPLEILIQNQSEGEAIDLNINVEFPEELKIMRGTTNKQIYSLRTNEDIMWEINLKPIEAGDYIIKINIKFKDPDQNLIEEIKEFPFSIKL